MLTPWGDLPVADGHVHFFSHGFLSLLAAQRGCTTADVEPLLGGWEMPPVLPEDLAGRWAAELDRHGVSRAALIASLPGDELSVASALRACPGRFFGYFIVNPMAPNAPATLDAALEAGLRGPCFFPAMHRYPLGDERVLAMLDRIAVRPGCVAFVHCGVLTVGIRKKLGLPSPFDLRFSNPVDVQPLAQRYPRLPFVIPHFGAGYYREALMLCDLCPNVYLDTSSTNSWMRYQEPGCDLAGVFRRALDVAGPSRLVFGTDSSFFPRGWHRAVFDQQLAALQAAGADEAAARAVLCGNFERLFPTAL